MENQIFGGCVPKYEGDHPLAYKNWGKSAESIALIWEYDRTNYRSQLEFLRQQLKVAEKKNKELMDTIASLTVEVKEDTKTEREIQMKCEHNKRDIAETVKILFGVLAIMSGIIGFLGLLIPPAIVGYIAIPISLLCVYISTLGSYWSYYEYHTNSDGSWDSWAKDRKGRIDNLSPLANAMLWPGVSRGEPIKAFFRAVGRFFYCMFVGILTFFKAIFEVLSYPFRKG